MSENTDQNTANVRLDLSQFEGHTPGPWREILDQGPEDFNGWDELQEMGFNDEARDLIAAAPDLLEELIETRKELDFERNAEGGSVSNERIWAQIDRNNMLAAQRVSTKLGLEVQEKEGEGGYMKYPDPGCGLDSETGRFDVENYELVNPPERLWLEAVSGEINRLRGQLLEHQPPVEFQKDWHSEHPRYLRTYWVEEVMAGHTQLGYWGWVNHQIDIEDDDDEEDYED